MNPYPYLRAYLAGIFVPTLVLPLVLCVFIIVRVVLREPIPIEQAMIFPMAGAPILFGIWNMVYLASHERTHLPIGIHGAILPFFIAPVAATTGSCFGVLQIDAHGLTWFHACTVPFGYIAIGFLVALAVYYLVWKFIVGGINRVLGIA